MNSLWKVLKDLPDIPAGSFVEADNDDCIGEFSPADYPEWFEFIGVPFLYCQLCGEKLDEEMRTDNQGLRKIVYEHHCKKIVREKPLSFDKGKKYCWCCHAYHDPKGKCGGVRDMMWWEKEITRNSKGELVSVFKPSGTEGRVYEVVEKNDDKEKT